MLSRLLIYLLVIAPVFTVADSQPQADVDSAELWIDEGGEPAPSEQQPVAERRHEKKHLGSNRIPASFDGGFKNLKADCNMRLAPTLDGQVIMTVTAGKKLWLDPESDRWYKAYHKNGHGYLSAACF